MITALTRLTVGLPVFVRAGRTAKYKVECTGEFSVDIEWKDGSDWCHLTTVSASQDTLQEIPPSGIDMTYRWSAIEVGSDPVVITNLQ